MSLPAPQASPSQCDFLLVLWKVERASPNLTSPEIHRGKPHVSSRNAGRSLNSLSAPAAQNWPAGPEEQRPVRRGPRSPAEAPAAVRGRPARRPLPRERCPADRPGHAHATVQAPKCRAACSAATPTGTPNVTLTLTLARQDRARAAQGAAGSPAPHARGLGPQTRCGSAPAAASPRQGRGARAHTHLMVLPGSASTTQVQCRLLS